MSALIITRIGPIAADSLAHDGDAEVAAVFERSAVIMTSHGFITLGGEALGDGPLNVLLSKPFGPLDWVKHGITRELKGSVRARELSLGSDFAVDAANAPLWQPPPWGGATAVHVSASVQRVQSMEVSGWPADGLSRLVLTGKPGSGNRTAQAAAPTVATLRASLAQTLRDGQLSDEFVRAATLMIGLGPGLTPSGDDLLGGLLLTLSALGETGIRDALWHRLADEMDMLTTGLSGAHVMAAADGMAGAAYHAALNALLSNDSGLPAQIDVLRSIGHSSGCDALAGMVLTLKAALAAQVLSP